MTMERRSVIWVGATLLLVVTAFVLLIQEKKSLASVVYEGATKDKKQIRYQGAQLNAAQKAESNRSRSKSILRLPNFDSDRLLQENPLRKGHPLRFAKRLPVNINPGEHGEWKVRDGKAQWSFRIEAPGAVNLNLGFSRFFLPENARLELRVGGQLLVRPFTARDNESHGELWTPVVAASEIDLRLEMPDDERGIVELELTSVNRGFRALSFAAGARKIGNEAPDGDCHIDVVCSAAESGVGPAIDQYRDQIRAAGAYTLNGEDTCSGSAVNNTRGDRRPYFITADHCGVTSSNAPSMVVYWNHENSSCRTPGSNQNGGDGNGPLSDFNSGAILRSSYTAADMALVELDDPIDPEHDVYLAGWSRTGEIPEMAVGIHFPATSEKRISFDFDALRSTRDYSSVSSPDGTHWMIIDWDHGTTEGGSSGSPIYDQNGRMVGQLSGGDAACGNDDPDWYGKFSEGWEGGGSSGSRLRDWLDPDGTGALTVDGISLGVAEVILSDAEVTEGDSGTRNLQFTIRLSQSLEDRVNFLYSTEDDTALAGSDYASASDVLVSIPAGRLSANFSISINGDSEAEENERFRVILSSQGGAPVNLSGGEAWGIIRNDDFIIPVLEGPSLVRGTVGENVNIAVSVRNTPTEFALTQSPSGMQIDAQGAISWLPSVAGDYVARVRVANEAGSVTGVVRFLITPNALSQAVDSPGGFLFRSGGSAPFEIEASGDSLAGNNRAQSGGVGDGEESWLEVTVDGPDYLGFWWKVSSEEGYDFLSLSVDGELRRSLSGERDWEYRVIAIPPGSHTVRWSYNKDSSSLNGADRGWIDFLQLASRSMPFLMDPPYLRLPAETSVDYQFPLYSGSGNATFSPVRLGGGLLLNERGEITGRPVSPGVVNFNLAVTQGGEEMTIPATIEVMPDSPAGAAAYSADGPAWGLTWETTGSGEWISQADQTVDGQSAAAASGVGDSERAALSTWVFGPGEVSFSWRASSERDYDFLVFEVNERQVASLSGNSRWQEYTGELPYGWHKLTWAYEKDETESRRRDTGYLDNLSFSKYTGWVLQSELGQRTGVTLDPDGDGQGLLREYATGGTAWGLDLMPMPSLVGGSLRLEIDKSPGSGLHFDAEVSDNLKDWNRSERIILRDDEEAFHVRDQVGLREASKRFLRLTVHPLK
tara:strand:+ start:51 stop:3539 length:3489 start_codon:yes stop_codon:yes gene_type:complete